MTLTDEIEAVYAALPQIQCQRECWRACGPISMSYVEADRIVEHVAAHPLRLAMETGGELCPALSAMGGCMIYEVRPLICRLYGLIKALHCPHGCRPERWVGNREAHSLLARLESLGQPGRVPLPLPGAPTMDGQPITERELGLLAALRALSKGG